ncbi:MAG: DUF2142 domain-containing protein [Tepidisphaeraceae bacterium]|jgi:uncharacterized membrane protein
MNSRRLPNWFAIAAFLLGNGFVFVNPPLKAPDEWAHFARAYQVSRLQLLPRQQHGTLGGYIPVGIETLAKRFEMVAFDGASVVKILDGRRIPFDTSDVTFAYFPSIARYPWLPFVPQALGIAFARLCVHSALATMYFGREANLIGYIALVYAALRLTPSPQCRTTLALIALLPMSLHQAASLSNDATTIAMAIVVSAAVWRLSFLEGPASKSDLFLLFISTICLSFTKLVYSLTSLLVLMIPAKRLGGRRRHASIVGMILFCNCMTVVLWVSQFPSLPRINPDPSINPPQQVQYLLHHPGKIAPLLVSTAITHGKGIATGVIGMFGWNEIMMPMVLVVIYYALLLTSVGADGRPRYWRGAIVAVSTAIVEVAAILTTLYLEWTPVGERAVIGLSGRYFIPLLPLAIFLGGAGNRSGTKLDRLLLVVAALITAFSVMFLAQELYPGCPFSRFYYRWSD